MLIVVTGAAGLIGSHVAERFLADGHEVIGIDNLCTGLFRNLHNLMREHSAYQGLVFDVSKQWPQPFFDVVGQRRIDGVFHFASPASPTDYYAQPWETIAANVEATQRCLNFAAYHNARFLFASTSEVYGDPWVHPQPEHYWGNVNPIGPRSCYDESKRMGETLTMLSHTSRMVDTRIVRIFNTFGPRMRKTDGRLVPNVIVGTLEHGEVEVFGTGQQTRSFSYVSNTVDGIAKVFYEGDHLPYNVGTEAELSVTELVECVASLAGVPVKIRHLPALEDDPAKRRPDLTRLRGLGWTETVSLREGLQRTIDYFRHYGD